MLAIERLIEEQNSERGWQNQQNGIAFERKQWNIELKLGMLAIISSGSRSPIDVVSIRKDYVLLITCKENGYLTPKERRDLDNLKKRLPTFCRIQMRYKIGKKLHKVWY